MDFFEFTWLVLLVFSQVRTSTSSLNHYFVLLFQKFSFWAHFCLLLLIFENIWPWTFFLVVLIVLITTWFTIGFLGILLVLGFHCKSHRLLGLSRLDLFLQRSQNLGVQGTDCQVIMKWQKQTIMNIQKFNHLLLIVANHLRTICCKFGKETKSGRRARFVGGLPAFSLTGCSLFSSTTGVSTRRPLILAITSATLEDDDALEEAVGLEELRVDFEETSDGVATVGVGILKELSSRARCSRTWLITLNSFESLLLRLSLSISALEERLRAEMSELATEDPESSPFSSS